MELDTTEDFKNYIRLEHLPALNQEVTEHKFMRLLNTDESEGMTLIVHYVFENMENYNRHIAVTDSKLRKEIFERYHDKVLYFCSVLEKI